MKLMFDGLIYACIAARTFAGRGRKPSRCEMEMGSGPVPRPENRGLTPFPASAPCTLKINTQQKTTLPPRDTVLPAIERRTRRRIVAEELRHEEAATMAAMLAMLNRALQLALCVRPCLFRHHALHRGIGDAAESSRSPAPGRSYPALRTSWSARKPRVMSANSEHDGATLTEPRHGVASQATYDDHRHDADEGERPAGLRRTRAEPVSRVDIRTAGTSRARSGKGTRRATAPPPWVNGPGSSMRRRIRAHPARICAAVHRQRSDDTKKPKATLASASAAATKRARATHCLGDEPSDHWP